MNSHQRQRVALIGCGFFSPNHIHAWMDLDEAEPQTACHHHQGVDAIGEGFEVTGWATIDDLPEAIEDPTRRFALGVQWHPEADTVGAEIAALVEAARTVMR